MCGLVGMYGPDAGRADLDASLDVLAHRGPDAGGTFRYIHDGVPLWLGHRRLSIIDLSAAANQPLDDGDRVIVFNGEIYNYRELRGELLACGAVLRTASDTEVVLAGWRMWGAGVLAKLRGMFAFAIYERRSGQLVLARDRFGIKPLYVHYDRGRQSIAFASELDALLRLRDQPLPIDDTALAALLLYDWIPEQHCIYAGVTKLVPGSYLTFAPNVGCTVRRYWDPENLIVPSEPADADTLAASVEDSVRVHLVADVPVGVFLSGGLDSSLVAAIAARHDSRLRCYTIGFRPEDQQLEAMPDDLRYARQLAQQLGLPLHELEIKPLVHELVETMADALDEPVGDAAAINVLLLSRAARAEGIKVLLSGMGADEIFGGYRRHQACLLAAQYRRLPRLARTVVARALDHAPVASRTRGYTMLRWAKRFASFAELPEEAAYRRSYTYYEPSDLERLLGPRSHSAIDQLVAEHAQVYWAAGRTSDRDSQIRRMCFTDLQLFLPGLNLAYTDRASMAASVEVRVPFVDQRVVECAFRLSGRDRIHGRVQKRALKQVASRYLPSSVVHRPKASFGMPLRAWTTRDLREPIRDLLSQGELVSKGYLVGSEVARILDENDHGRADHAQAIWQLFTLEHWMRRAAGRTSRLRAAP